MTVRFLHTADLHLGMPFHRVPGDRGARLREIRLESIDRIAAAAREHGAQIVLVAGDMFDANTVDERVVQQACARLREAAVAFVVIPGNHDHCAAPDCVFLRRSFRDACPSNVHVCLTRDPVPMLGGALLVLPAPLLRRHEIGDTTEHVTRELGRDVAPGAVRVGLAHGGVVDFGPEPDEEDGERATNLVAPDRAERAALDYLALGDWHGCKRIDARTWYAGTPEPTSFTGNDPGHALLVEIEAPGALPRVEPIPVARSRFVRRSEVLQSREDLDALEAWLAAIPSPCDTAVRLEVAGVLPLAEAARLEALLDRADARLLCLRRAGAGVLPEATDDELDAVATDGYVKAAIDELRSIARGDGGQARSAALALQILYRIHATTVAP
jgi:DNA repair exonuclease SbcCD nuclease subunit